MARDVIVLVGSLRRESFTRKTAKALVSLAPATLKLEFVEFSSLPFYNADLETEQPPQQWVAFRERVRRSEAVLFVTPEYNRSVPGALKNAIDVGCVKCSCSSTCPPCRCPRRTSVALPSCSTRAARSPTTAPASFS